LLDGAVPAPFEVFEDSNGELFRRDEEHPVARMISDAAHERVNVRGNEGVVRRCR
jgi:hypothetical protein